MMDTVLNLGLNDVTAEGMIANGAEERFVYDSYRRLVHMFGSVVLDIDDEAFEHPLDSYKEKKGYKVDTEMTAEDWKALTETYQGGHQRAQGFRFSSGSQRTIEDGDGSGLSLLERQARCRLP